MQTEFEKEKFIQEMDAQARIIIGAINAIGTDKIAQFGNLSHNAQLGGAVSAMGDMLLSPDMAIRWKECPQIPVLNNNYLSAGTTFGQQNQQGSFLLHCFLIERIRNIYPTELPTLLANMGGQYDFIHLSRSLGLDRQDYDKIDTGKIVRSFMDNTVSCAGSTMLPMYDHLDSFVRMDILYLGAVFEIKSFKFTDHPGIFPLLFKPEHPGVWFPWWKNDNVSIRLETDVESVINPISEANAWLNDAGDLAELDSEIFRNKQVIFLWNPQNLHGGTQFSSALRFVAEMKKHGIQVNVKDCVKNAILTQDDLIHWAYRYNLVVPDCIKEKDYILSIKSCVPSVQKRVPFFWSHGSSTLFFGPGHKDILKKLLLSFGGKFHNEFPVIKNIAILCPETAETRARKLKEETNVDVPFIRESILHSENKLEKYLCTNTVELLFVVYAGEFRDKAVTRVLDLCEKENILTAVFAENTLENVDNELLAQKYFAIVAQDKDSIIIKNMIIPEIKKYSFKENSQTEEQPSSEEEINEIPNGGVKWK